MGNNVTKDSEKKEFEDLKKDLNESYIYAVAAEYRKCLNKMQNGPLHIAVTGLAGSGKSSLVNSMRSVNDDNKEAALVGITEGTMEPKAYPHPSFPNVKLWDLPGIGTPKFKAAEYLEKVNFKRYDVFIIVSSDRFIENDALLAKEIQKMGKKFYYVRSKIDASIQGEKRKSNFNMEKTLENIKNYCQAGLRSSGDPSARVFLVSSWEVQKYDFCRLQETIAADLPDHKKHIFTLSVNTFSEDKLKMKKELMKTYIKKAALVSCVYGVVPVPGLSMICDIGILVFALIYFCKVFGLEDWSLSFLACQTGKEFEELKSAIKKTPLSNTINADLVLSLLAKSALWVTASAVELALDFIPVLGSVVGGVSSFIVTYHFLNNFLEDAVEDARNVLAKFLK